MKTTLIVIQNDADHAQTQALIEKLMNSNDSATRLGWWLRLAWPKRMSALDGRDARRGCRT
jgi:hypothetical protein